MKVTLGVVHGKDIDSWYFHSMIGLTTAPRMSDHVIDEHICIRSGPLLSAGRGSLAGSFLEHTTSDALLMLDSDMAFKPARIYEMIDVFARAREQYPDLGALGGLAFIGSDERNTRPKPNLWVAGKFPGQHIQLNDYPENALVEVSTTGAACVIIAREVLQGFADEKVNPFHYLSIVNWPMLARDVCGMDDWQAAAAKIQKAVWNADQLGEDMSFFTRVRANGWRVFVHTGLQFDHAKSILLGEQEFRQVQAAQVVAPNVLIAQEA